MTRHPPQSPLTEYPAGLANWEGAPDATLDREGFVRGRGHLAACTLVALFVSALGAAASARGDVRDDTAWLQTKLDAGGNVFLPKLPDGQCYATRGLWVSR